MKKATQENTAKADKSDDKKAIMALDGARCLSCIYTIEHLGRKIPGVRDIYVDSRSGKIFVEYSGDAEPFSAIAAIIRRIGYDAPGGAEGSGLERASGLEPKERNLLEQRIPRYGMQLIGCRLR